MRLNLPHPSNWSDFQDLCFLLWKEMWRDPNAHHNGRNGQSQNGVDIWGKDVFDPDYTGIQCKGKNENYGSQLTTDEIDNECKKAVSFQPSLKSFIMATTSPRDVAVQRHCRILTKNCTYPFRVDTWSWDDIEDEVQCRPTIMDRFYPEIKTASLLTEIQIPIFASADRLHAFFSRPGLFCRLNALAINILRDLAYEIAIKAFEHGGARSFGIKVENSKIVFTDNGVPFDPIKLLEIEGNGGKATMKYATELFGISYKYEEQNILELELPEHLSISNGESNHTIHFDANQIFGRGQAERYILSEFLKVPTDSKKIIVDISGQVNPAISCSLAVIDRLLQIRTENQQVVIYLPDNLYYKDDIMHKYCDEPNFIIKVKD